MSNTLFSNGVSIQPGIGILTVLQHLNYKPWFALAEFVDNSLQSYLSNKEALEKVEGAGFRLRVDINVHSDDLGGVITIRDNAAGISAKDFPRAFRPAEIPPNASGLSEFGVGMKSAAFWFSSVWQVRTKALGEDVQRTVYFNLQKIKSDGSERVAVEEATRSEREHFTEIKLNCVRQVPVKKTLGKIKEHLASIYRCFLREEQLDLFLNEEKLEYSSPEILTAPPCRAPSDPEVEWRREFAFDFGGGLSAHGFAAIRKYGSRKDAGFALFRRRRVIQGSGDEGYRPEAISGQSNSHQWQRLFGEIHLEGFEVSHTKDGFKWDGNEEAFVACLREKLLPLIQQARDYRARGPVPNIQEPVEKAISGTTEELERHAPQILQELAVLEDEEPEQEVLPETRVVASRQFEVDLRGERWRIAVEASNDGAQSDWLEVTDARAAEHRQVTVRIALAHPFMARFASPDALELEPIIRIAAAFALGEVVAYAGGATFVAQVRRTANELLSSALSKA